MSCFMSGEARRKSDSVGRIVFVNVINHKRATAEFSSFSSHVWLAFILVTDSNPLALMINPQSRASASGLARYKQDAVYYVCSRNSLSHKSTCDDVIVY